MKKNLLGGQLKNTRTFCDNITGKRLIPEAVQIARREELEFMDKLEVLKEVLVEQCWSETSAKPT